MLKPLDLFTSIIVREYCKLRNQSEDEEESVSMYAFFDSVKTSLLGLWERDIVKCP